MSFQLIGIGTALPHELITQEDAARQAVAMTIPIGGNAAAIQTIFERTGVKKRHSTLITSSTNGEPATQDFFSAATDVTSHGPTTGDRMCRYEIDALELAARAAGAALQNASTTADEIAHLVTVSCTGFSAPGVDIQLIERLELPRSVSRTHLGFMGCHGALNGLRTAAALSRSNRPGKVLLCCVELCSLHYQLVADWQQIIANALFADGAAAVVGEATDAEQVPWRVVDQFSYIAPNTKDLMAWRIGDHGFEMRLSPEVPKAIETNLRPWLAEQLGRHSLAIGDVQSWAIHPGGPRILIAAADSLGIDHALLDSSRWILEEFGNMSSPTVLFILEHLRRDHAALPCVALAFGPGLTMEAALIG